jgi:hypothetical protein
MKGVYMSSKEQRTYQLCQDYLAESDMRLPVKAGHTASKISFKFPLKMKRQLRSLKFFIEKNLAEIFSD